MLDMVRSAVTYLEAHPDHGLALVAVIIAAYYLLNYRPRMVREAERRLAELREERGHLYRGLRPPNGPTPSR